MVNFKPPIITIFFLSALLFLQKQYSHAQTSSTPLSFIEAAYDSLNMDRYHVAKDIFLQLENKHGESDNKLLLCKINTGLAISSYFSDGITLSDSAARSILKYEKITENNKSILAPAYYAIAGHAKRRKDFDLALACLDTSINLIRNSSNPDTSILGRAYGLRGQCLYRKGELNNALEAYKNALAVISTFLKANPAHIVKYTQTIGTIYAAQGNFENAIPFFNEALNLKKQYNLPSSRNDIIYHNNLGMMYFDRREYHQAANMFNEAIRIATELYGSGYELLGTVYLNQGNIYVQVADFTKAREYYLKALTYQSISETKYQTLINNIGYTYFRQNEYEKAIDYFLESIEYNKSTRIAISSMRSLAQNYIGLKRADEAEKYFIKAVEFSKKLNDTINLEYAISLQDYGLFLVETSRAEKGIKLWNESLTIFQKRNTERREDEANIHRYLADYYASNNTYNKALHHLQEALIALEPDFSSKEYADNPDVNQSESPYELLGILSLKANVLQQLGEKESDITDLKQANNTYALTSEIFDNLKSFYSYDESKLFISGQSNAIFQNAINVAYNLYYITRDHEYLNTAFFYTEKSKYSTLLEAYRESILRTQTIAPTELEKLTTLQKKIEKTNHLLYSEQKSDSINQIIADSLNSKIFDLNRKKDSIEEQIIRANPGFIVEKKNTDLITPEKVQSNLSNKQVLIEYSLIDSVVYAFCITNKDFSTEKVIIETAYLDSLRLSLHADELANYTTSDYQIFARSSYYLYNKLLSPFEEKFKNKSIIIIPDSRLGYIPFEALISEMPSLEKMDYRKPQYLIKEHGISYSYSSTLLFEDQENKNSAGNSSVLAFAPEYYYGQNRYRGDSTLNYLASIPGVSDEVSTICASFNGVALYGNQATETAFKEMAPEYDILHLAMHTLIDAQNPSYSRLVFSYPGADSINDDGVLYASELFTLSLKSRMAVLSACQTGDGEISEGEGILSLARGFFYAGVPSVVMTLWSVDDARSSEIMGAFYEYLKKGFSKEKALQQAKLDILGFNDPVAAHPRFWAGYVTIGDQSPVKKNNTTTFIIIGIFLLTAGFFTFRRLRR